MDLLHFLHILTTKAEFEFSPHMEVFWDSCPGEYVSQCTGTIVLCMQSLPSSHTLLRLKLCAIACWTVTSDCTDEIQRNQKHPSDAEFKTQTDI